MNTNCFVITRTLFVSFLFVVLSASAVCAVPDSNDISQNYADKFSNWLRTNSDQDTGLPFSHVGDARFQHWTITYDAAVVALAYSAVGKYSDAKKILDYYIDTPQIWRLGGIIECYVAGKTFLGKDWSVRGGANIWIGIAAINLYLSTKEQKYLELAEKIANFTASLQNSDNKDANYGGIALGPKGDPAYSKDQYIGCDLGMPEFYRVYATEVSIDGYALFQRLFQVTKKNTYQLAAANCLQWLKNNAWNKSEHRFNRGYKDQMVATDVQSWGISALGVDGLNFIEPGAAERMIAFVEENCLSESSFVLAGKTMIIRGVDFTDKKRVGELKRLQMVSFEWTFQLINAYGRLAHDYKQLGENKKAEIYRSKREQLLEQLLAAASEDSSGLAFPYATLSDAEIGHENKTPSTGSLSAVGGAWAILAIQESDPLTQYSCIDLANRSKQIGKSHNHSSQVR